MPVTKTAKRALRSSARKAVVNTIANSKLEIAIRHAKKSRGEKDINLAAALVDRASKKGLIHKNKAAHIKSLLSKLHSKKGFSTHKSKKTAKKK